MRAPMFSLILLALAAPQVHAFELKTDDEGHSVAWARAEVVYRMEAQGARDLTEAASLRAVKGAFGAWDQAAEGLRIRFGGVVSNVAVGFDREAGAQNANVVHFSRDVWSFDSPTALAVTLTTYRAGGGGLVDADIVVNETHYAWSEGPEGDHDLQNTLAHEAGHFLGLAHSAEAEATMYARATPHETKKRDLHLDDVQGVQRLYGGDWVPPEAGTESELEAEPPGGCQAGPWAASPPLWVWIFGVAGLLALRRRRALAVVAVFGGLFMAEGQAQASAFRALSLEGLAERADFVVEGPVVAVTARWEGGLIITHALIRVEVCHLGRCPAEVLARTVGGRVGDLIQEAEGLAHFDLGEQALVFMGPARPDGARAVIGAGQGKFSVLPGPDGGWAFRSLHPLPLVGPEAPAARAWRAVPAASLRAALAALRR
ncbi:MAG: matrixin family metalloprotease [Myxococcales bacterium]|nr:matrixin family metalloprotease [Myxococcales bacterium]MCB9524324.1 matrixin family metalloprotease [Myxococcales bacterium]